MPATSSSRRSRAGQIVQELAQLQAQQARDHTALAQVMHNGVYCGLEIEQLIKMLGKPDVEKHIYVSWGDWQVEFSFYTRKISSIRNEFYQYSNGKHGYSRRVCKEY